MNRQQLSARLEKAWRNFEESYAGLSDSQMLQPGVTGAWSVRDILAHVTTWEAESLKHLPTILKGKKPPRYSVTHGGINAFNAQMTEQKKTLTLAEVRRELENTHDRIPKFIARVREEQFRSDTPFRRRLRLDTYSHYPKHPDAIKKKWRKQHL